MTDVPEFYLDEAVAAAQRSKHRTNQDDKFARELVCALADIGLIKIKPRPNFTETLQANGFTKEQSLLALQALTHQGFEVKRHEHGIT